MDVEVWREHSPARINELINDPQVRPDVAPGTQPLDLHDAVANGRNYLIMGEHGGILFGCIDTGIYEAHTVVRPGARGRWTRGMITSAVHYMFTKTDCYEIATRVPDGHQPAMAAAIGTGMRMEFTLPDAVEFRGKKRDVHILSYRIQDWMINAPGLEARGAWFHRHLHAEAERLGVTAPPHEDWPVHNRYVGACVEMAFSSQIRKGVLLYNRASRLMRHATVEFLDFDRVQADIGTIVFRSDGNIEVLRDAV